MNIFHHFEQEIAKILAGIMPEGGIESSGFTCETPRDASHGDMATNAAMVLAKRAGVAPRELAERIKGWLEQIENVREVEIAGPGFINLRLDPIMWQERIGDILREGAEWGKSAVGKGKRVNVEFVSANPTGPLHAAHARGAIIGDALASLLESAGYAVVREYYINDAGAQVEALGRSLRYRYGGEKGEKPEGYYPGEYLKETAEKMNPGVETADEFRDFAVADMLESIKADLARLGIRMDRFSSERALVEDGAVERVMERLEKDGLLYRGVLEPPKGKLPDDWEPREQLLFRATQFGDDVDRPVQKSDGSWTYFAADMAYHLDKLNRDGEGSVDTLINIWGADHGGYVKRMQAAVAALSGREGALDVKLCQLVTLMDGGKPVKMSKRAGTFVTLSDVLDSVGKDILRFIMLTRRSDQSMDFDYAKVTEQSKDNPVFYVQYAHARACSVLRKEKYDSPDMSLLAAGPELNLVKMLASWPRMVESAALAHEPHRIAFALTDIAAAFHALWNAGRDDGSLRFIIEDDPAITSARLALVDATRQVISNGLAILGVQAVEEM